MSKRIVEVLRSLLLALVVTLSVASKASAQTYVLTFTNETVNTVGDMCAGGGLCTVGGAIATDYGTVTGVVTALNGVLTAFGSASAPAGSIYYYGGGCCGEPANDAGSPDNLSGVAYAYNGTGTGVGMFSFTTAVGSSVTFNSVWLGSSLSGVHTGTVNVYTLANAFLSGQTVNITGGQQVVPPTVVTSGTCQDGGLKVEWGAGNQPYSNYIVDNLSFTVNSTTCAGQLQSVVPEPVSMTLLGIGLVALVPAGIRRRRRS